MFVGSSHRVIVCGKITSEVVLRELPNGISVLDFQLPTNFIFRDKDGQNQTATTWFKVILKGKTAEVSANALSRGCLVQVEGRLKPDIAIWFDVAGSPKASYELLADQIIFLTKV